MICPECNKDSVCFCGLRKDDKGKYVNLWECLNPDCQHEWTVPIDKEQEKDFNE